MNWVDCQLYIVWRCPECNHRNNQKIYTADLTEEEVEEQYREDHDIEPWQDVPDLSSVEIINEPRVVKCKKCRSEFQNSNYQKEEEDESGSE